MIELPRKINQDIAGTSHITLRIGNTKSRLNKIIDNRTKEVLEIFLNKELNPPKYKHLGTAPRPLNCDLSPNTNPGLVHLPARKSRRRANSELSCSPKSSNHLAKRVALE